jgi:hypothetical protein
MGCLKGKLQLSMWLALTGASIVAVDHASACSCVPSSADAVIQSADVVFEGEVVDVTRLLGSDFWSDLVVWELRAQLRVLTPLKGQPGDIVMVYTPEDGAMCGVPFRTGQRFKVVAWHNSNHQLHTNICAMSAANHR